MDKVKTLTDDEVKEIFLVLYEDLKDPELRTDDEMLLR